MYMTLNLHAGASRNPKDQQYMRMTLFARELHVYIYIHIYIYICIYRYIDVYL